MHQSRISKFFQPKSSASSSSSAVGCANSDVVVGVKRKAEVISVDIDQEERTTPSCPADKDVNSCEREFAVNISKRAQLREILSASGNDGDIDRRPESGIVEQPVGAKVVFTPLEKQVMDIRRSYPDSLLMVECGYRMRFFGMDAVAAAKALSIQSRPDHNFVVASVPTYRAFVHCQRLLSAGYKVAIVRQSETAAIRKGNKVSSSSTFDRVVAGVFTEGTLIDSDDPAFEGIVRSSDTMSPTEETSDDENDDSPEADMAVECIQQEQEGEADLWIMSIVESRTLDRVAMVSVNVKAHRLQINLIGNDLLRQGVADYLDLIKPTEVLLDAACSDRLLKLIDERCSSQTPQTTREQSYIKRMKTEASSFFDSSCSKDIGATWLAAYEEEVVGATCGLWRYLKEFDLDQMLRSPTISRHHITGQSAAFEKIRDDPHSPACFVLDGVTIRDLEVFQALSGTMPNDAIGKLSASKSSSKRRQVRGLFGVIDHCRTVYGRRALKSWLLQPLLHADDINRRLDLVAWLSSATEFSASAHCRQVFTELFTAYPDVEVMLSALQFGRISPPRAHRMLQFASQLTKLTFGSDISQQMPSLLKDWLALNQWVDIARVSVTYQSQLSTADNESSASGIFTSTAEQQFPEIVSLISQRNAVSEGLSNELNEIRRVLRRPSLQYSSLRSGPTAIIEHLIELPLKDEAAALPSWSKISSTKQLVRFHTPVIIELQQELHRIRDELKRTVQSCWRQYCLQMKNDLYDHLRSTVTVLANVDAAMSLAIVAQFPNYCRPTYQMGENAKSSLIIEQGRHPVLERVLEDSGSSFLPNDVSLNQQFGPRSFQLITGPNMGGKSSFVRMIGLIALLGQIGSYVPASAANLCIFDNIFTRMGAGDDLSSGKSTFMCELVRTSCILRKSTKNSLVIVDELGRGTATNDGQAIAQATMEHIIKTIGCATLFITHFHQLSKLVESGNFGVQAFNSHMSYVEEVDEEGESQVVFLYKSVETPASGSHGINVAKLAGIANGVLQRAVEMSNWMKSLS